MNAKKDPESNRGVKNIGIDLTSLKPLRITGLEVYALNLASALLDLHVPSISWTIFLPRSGSSFARTHFKGVHCCISPLDNRIFNDQVWLPFQFMKRAIHTMYCPTFPPSPIIASKCIITIPDTTLWDFPETASFGGRYYYKRLYEFAASRARLVFTISESTKRRLGLRFPARNVLLARCSLDTSIYSTQASAAGANRIRSQFGLHGRVLLFVGTIEPRKNISTLIEAFLKLDRGFHPCTLLLVGRLAWGRELADAYRGFTDIVFTGYIDRESIAACYQIADLVVLPSHYEGFGLPILEAFHFQQLVCCSRIEAHAEVAGDAAVYFDPDSVDELVDAISSCLRLSARERGVFLEKQRRRLDEFSWEVAAKSIVSGVDLL